MHTRGTGEQRKAAFPGGLAGWLWSHWRKRGRHETRLAVIDRITLAPRQTLSLVEADGRRLLVASSAEGAAAFYPLDGQRRIEKPSARHARVSW